MKKFFMLAIAAMALTFVSCSDPVSKAKDYQEDIAEAAKAGDTEKVEELTKEYEEWLQGLSEEDQAKVAEAAVKGLKEALGD